MTENLNGTRPYKHYGIIAKQLYTKWLIIVNYSLPLEIH